MNHYYLPSGKLSGKSILFLILLSLTAFPLLGLIYAYAIWYIPFIYINFIIAGAFGFAVGFLVNKVVIGTGKVRNVPLAVLFSLLAGLIALYFHWAVWIDLVINAGESYGTSRIGVTMSNIDTSQVFYLILHPLELFTLIGEVNEFGTWGIRSATVSGTFLTVIWVLEFLIIVGASTLIGFTKARDPFCEQENEWFEESIAGQFSIIENPHQAVQDLESGEIEGIKQLKRLFNPTTDHSLFTLYSSNFLESYLTIENKKAKINKDGELEFDDETVVEYISIDQTLRDHLLNAESNSEKETKEINPEH